MKLREAIQQIKGFRYITEQLELCSSLGRRTLYELAWLERKEQVEEELERVAEVVALSGTAAGKSLLEKITCRLMLVRDIRGTVARTGGNGILDDLELFELKSFALLAEELRELVAGWRCVRIPAVAEVVELLDPEGTRIPQFYVYDAYSAELAALRAEMKACKRAGGDGQHLERMYARGVELEDKVREELSVRLRGSHAVLREALEQVAWLDIVIAKARQAVAMGLVKPVVAGGGETCLRQLFHPQLRETLEAAGKRYQPVDIRLVPGTTLITGANMAGKTVLLKSVALAQCMLQFGFYVPAAQAEMVLVDGIEMSIGDEQDELSGLSSFAAEMLRVNEIVGKVREGKKVLVLIDELARTTNPAEGRAIVNGVVGFMTDSRAMAMVTTHYGGITAPCRKLRVKGFVEERANGEVTWQDINEFIDYSLEEDCGGEVPHEALRIAELLGVDKELLARAEEEIKQKVQ